MRHWNGQEKESRLFQKTRFYSTYEALKHAFAKQFTDKLRGFYSTYEALKHIKVFLTLQRKGGFYSTYEALKPAIDITSTKEYICFYSTYEALKLFSKSNFLAKHIKFLLYLWGIETGVPYPSEEDYVIVFTLPMRHWNLCWEKNPAECHRVFTLPMRHWNNLLDHEGLLLCIRFYSTYEALKPKKRRGR